MAQTISFESRHFPRSFALDYEQPIASLWYSAI
jgi:hypothetical protein